MLLSEVVATSNRVASTSARSGKIAALASLLAELAADEVEAAVAFLAGEPRQGKIGVGWATIVPLEVTPARDATLTIADVDRVISHLQTLGGPGSAASRQQHLGDLLGRATADEVDFIRRLLIGELRQGALEGVVTEAVAKAAGVRAESVRRSVMLAGNLPKVAAIALIEGESGLAAIGLEVLRPVQPMLAATAADVAEAIAANGLSSVEWKLDGARIQAHRVGDEVRLFTRNQNDVTARLPGVVDVVASLPGKRFILDGEVVGVGSDERPDPFQDTMSRFSRRDGLGAAADLGVWWFDCLHVDGADLIDLPLVERASILATVAGQWRVPSVLTDDPAVAAAFLDGALAAGHEGVMVKSASSRYEAGRRGQAWRKVKPVRTLDLVVLAAEWGHGRRRGWLSNLHLGARDPAGGWVMVGKTFKGLTDDLLTWQTARFLELEVGHHGGVVEVRPELVVEIALDGVQVSSRYSGGVALRFARVRRYRPDKVAAEADDINAVRALLAPRRT
jgi:ATP-dependent DNA ligase I